MPWDFTIFTTSVTTHLKKPEIQKGKQSKEPHYLRSQMSEYIKGECL